MTRPTSLEPDRDWDAGTRSGGGRALVWSAFAGLAFLIFKLTADPVVAVSAFCLKFAAADIVIALRLLSRDPAFLRGVCCAMFHLSLGAMKALGASLASAFVIGVIFQQGFRLQGVARGQAWQTTEALLWIALWSWGAAVLVSLFGTVIAWQSEFRIWLSSGTGNSLAAGVWPPRPVESRNRVAKVILIQMTAVLAFSFAIVFIVLTRPGPRGGLLAPGVAALLGVLVGGVLPIFLAFFLLWLGGRLRRAIEARSPEECWPDDSMAVTIYDSSRNL